MRAKTAYGILVLGTLAGHTARAYDNDYAARNNSYERPMLECFSQRIVLGGKWDPDDGLQSAKQLTKTQMCSDLAKAYFYWCKNNGGDSSFCEEMTVKGAQLIISTTPYHERMHETPEEAKQMDAAIAETRIAADAGDRAAQTKLGMLYFESNGVRPRSPVEALPWFERAAAQGEVLAQAKLGIFYQYGIGVKRNPLRAKELWEKAAAQGSAEASTYLGTLYENGDEGVPKSGDAAAKWYKIAAERGDERANQLLKKVQERLHKSGHPENMLFIDTKWGINQSSDEDPACMQDLDHEPGRYEKPSRHALDVCFLQMIKVKIPYSDIQNSPCLTPLLNWCSDQGLIPRKNESDKRCVNAGEAEYKEITEVCGTKVQKTESAPAQERLNPMRLLGAIFAMGAALFFLVRLLRRSIQKSRNK